MGADRLAKAITPSIGKQSSESSKNSIMFKQFISQIATWNLLNSNFTNVLSSNVEVTSKTFTDARSRYLI